MPDVDHSDVGFVPAGADHSDVGFVPHASEKPELDPLFSVAGLRERIAPAMTNPRTYTGLLPMAGAVVGGALGTPAGPVGTAVGTGMGAAAGEGLRHVADTALGYEKPITSAADFGHELGAMGKEGAINAGMTAGIGIAATKAAPVLEKIGDAIGVSAGRRALAGGATLANATREALPDAAVRAARTEGPLTFGASTNTIAEKLQAVRDTLGDQKARILVALKQRGVPGPEAEALAEELAMGGRTAATTATNPAVRNVYDSEASALRAREPPQPGQTYGDYTVPRDANGNLDLPTSEARKTSAMNEASYGNYSDTSVNQAKQGVGHIYKEANENAISQGAAASNDPITQAIAANFQPLKERLGNVIAASDVANMGAGRAMNRAMISPKTAAFTAAKIASGAGIPDAALTAGATGLLLSRGQSALSATGFNVASGMQKLQAIVQNNPAAIGRYGAILSKALSEGDKSFAANAYALSQTDPQFQQLQRELDQGK